MGYLTSGNEIVDAMGTINISGNVIPAVWYRTITKENGKPYLLAIVILADIVYWYRPSEVRDQGTGHILGWKKKFSDDMLRQSYQYYADLLGESKKTIKTAMDKLEKLQVIRREFRTVTYGDGLVCNNVMYVELNPEMLYRLTFPEEISAVDGENSPYAEVTDDQTGGSLPTAKDTPMEISGGSLPTKRDTPMENFGGRGIPNGIQVPPKRDIGPDKMGESLPPKRDIGPSQKGETNTYTSTKTSNREFYPIYPITQPDGETEEENEMDGRGEVKLCMEQIRNNIDYEWHMKNDAPGKRELYDELYEVICEIVCIRRPSVRIGGDDYPYELVKSRFMKLTGEHLEYVIECMKETTTKITHIKSYMVTALYNAPTTINHYYQQEAQHDMYGGGWSEENTV